VVSYLRLLTARSGNGRRLSKCSVVAAFDLLDVRRKRLVSCVLGIADSWRDAPCCSKRCYSHRHSVGALAALGADRGGRSGMAAQID